MRDVLKYVNEISLVAVDELILTDKFTNLDVPDKSRQYIISGCHRWNSMLINSALTPVQR